MSLPYIAIGNDELAQQPDMGDTIRCWMCGQDHPVEYGTVLTNGVQMPSKTLAFMRCGDKSYLCGVNGKEWKPKDTR